MSAENYSLRELMAVVAARQLRDGKAVAVGTGLPLVAAMFAQLTHAPNLVIFFEAGGIAPQLPTLPVSVGDSRTIHKALCTTTLIDIMDSMRRGFIDYAFLGGAQIDGYGNLNSTMIGDDYEKPKVRFPGSGGANDFGSLAWETLIIMDREGLSEDTGPSRVITDLCLMDFEPESKRMRLIATHPGIKVDDVIKATGFELIIADNVETTKPPTKEDLRLLHEVIDPNGFVFKK
jgi:glutaconate CoA-transferase subunit B